MVDCKDLADSIVAGKPEPSREALLRFNDDIAQWSEDFWSQVDKARCPAKGPKDHFVTVRTLYLEQMADAVEILTSIIRAMLTTPK